MRLAAVLVLLSTAPAGAAEVRAGALVIEGAFSRATAGASAPGVAYLRIRNTGDAPDRLVGASTSAAGAASLHVTMREGEVMRMRALTGIDVPPGATVALSPDSRLHLMLEGLHAPLRAGATLPLTLRFERAGEVTLAVPVSRPGAMMPEAP